MKKIKVQLTLLVVEETETIFSEITTNIENKKESILDNTNSISPASQEISASTEEQITQMKYMSDNIDKLRKISDVLSNKIFEFKL